MTESVQPKGNLALQTVAMPKDTNANGDVFGGWLVSNMDMGAAIEGRHRSMSRVATVAIDKLEFIRPVYVGDTVRCYADLMRVGRTSMQFMVEVWTLSINETEYKKVAHGIFTFVAINEQGKPQPVDR